MAEYLGPLELVGDRWIIGDPKREDGMCLVLTAEGMEHHRNGAADPLEVVPWSRFMELRLQATPRAWMATRPAGVLAFAAQSSAVPMGRSASSVHALVRHPYDDWFAHYGHHRHAYTDAHVHVVQLLIRTVSEAGLLPRLGDPEWLGAVVAKAAPLNIRPSTKRRVKELVEGMSG
ncbi:hypothetical protein [Streptomyces sp. NPDC050848]|uniref:hypothetical protein n=1 Tax=Streptomyces sp. NPDC050848 TaxID=3155791 RepID=UPI0033ECCAD9